MEISCLFPYSQKSHPLKLFSEKAPWRLHSPVAVPLNYRAAPDAYYISKPKHYTSQVSIYPLVDMLVYIRPKSLSVRMSWGGSEALVALVYTPEKKRIVESTVIECFKRLCCDGVPLELPS